MVVAEVEDGEVGESGEVGDGEGPSDGAHGVARRVHLAERAQARDPTRELAKLVAAHVQHLECGERHHRGLGGERREAVAAQVEVAKRLGAEHRDVRQVRHRRQRAFRQAQGRLGRGGRGGSVESDDDEGGRPSSASEGRAKASVIARATPGLTSRDRPRDEQRVSHFFSVVRGR